MSYGPSTARGWHFSYPYPMFDNDTPFTRGVPWQNSIYYMWFEYLRRNQGYKEYCETQKSEQFADLYADFGNIHDVDFEEWWSGPGRNRGRVLFAEAMDAGVLEFENGNDWRYREDNNRYLNLSFPIDYNDAFLLAQLKIKLAERRKQLDLSKEIGEGEKQRRSTAKYQIETKNIGVPSLKQYLKVWDFKQANPEKTRLEIADNSKIALANEFEPETRKRTVSRYIAFANKLIENVGKGEFPKK